MSKKSDTRPFHFKQFSLYHHRSTMKTGTDAVLLGIWQDVNGVEHALDVGTGSGIIALLIAARSSARVDAVETDEDSFAEASENFNRSPFSGRMRIFHEDFNRFSQNEKRIYDLIVSNPPFFTNDLPSANRRKTLARHTASLTYGQLIEGVSRLLKPMGRFGVVIPYFRRREFLRTAANSGLFLQREMLIFPKPCKEPNRVNLELGFKPVSQPLSHKFIIRNENGSFTEKYIRMVGDYYISVG